MRSRCVTVTARAWVEDHARALRLTYLGGLCGAVFIVFKAHAWPTEVARGHTISSKNDFILYYMLTGVHLFHVLLGLLILGVVARELRNPRRRRMSMVESGPTYWHMVTCSGSSSRTVTCAWIILFANTIGSCWLAPGHARGATAVASAPITVAVVLLGFIKGHMIIRYFMEVRTAVAQAISPPGGSTFCGPEFSRSIHTKES